jgi:serine/threonine protein kinase
MALAAGTRLGPYEILSPLGAGGMGEVYRAKDSRLGREVAVKVLPASFSHDAERLRRFEQEARAASALNHPNILSLYDVGSHDGSPYVVSELLEGETLRARLASGALSPRRATEYAIHIAQGLAAAHEKGIVHRDLKPENLFLTEDGRAKILDFGLAKLVQPEAAPGQQTSIPTVSPGTEPGVVLGTVGYMSPEQVKGQAADHRSDIFSFGAILYEMLSGRRAFRGESAVETMSAILKEDPPDLSETNHHLSPGLERLVRHCLEKSPAQRFQSARDLAYDLEALSRVSDSRVAAVGAVSRARPSARWLLAALAGVGALVVALVLVSRPTRSAPPRFRQLTFRAGRLMGARFGPEGQSIFYSAVWGTDPPRVFSVRPESPESSALNLPEALLLAVSPRAELAIATKPVGSRGMLARVPISGGAPRELLSDVSAADWSPDGSELAVVHLAGSRWRLEFPIGKVLYESKGWISMARVSPKGDLVAIVDHPVAGDTPGSVVVVDRAGRSRVLSTGWSSVISACWSPDADEIWFSATQTGIRLGIWSVTLSGKTRLVADAPLSEILADVSPSGRALVVQQNYRSSMTGVTPGDTAEKDVSWLDFSTPAELSRDGKLLLFEEWGEGGGPKGSVYLQRFDGSPPVRLGEGLALGLSPDGLWALTRVYSDPPRLLLLPTGPGEPRPIAAGEGLQYEEWARFLPDGKRVVFIATDAGRARHLYIQDLAGGAPKVVGKEEVGSGGSTEAAVSPDGTRVAANAPDESLRLYAIDGSGSTAVAGAPTGQVALQWTPDGRRIYVVGFDSANIRVFLLDPATGRRELWRELHPNPAGLMYDNCNVVLTPDGRGWFAGYQHSLMNLYLAEGLK